MYDDFIANSNSNRDAVSYVSYTRVVKELHISFTKLGVEECESCSIHEMHKKKNFQSV